MCCLDDCPPLFQTVCVSQATRFLVLTGVHSENFSHEHIKLMMEVQHGGGNDVDVFCDVVTRAVQKGQCM